MLSITKNKPKSSMATVKFTSVPKKTVPKKIAPRPIAVPQYVPQYVPAPLPQVPQSAYGIQKNLTESAFRQYLRGYVQIITADLPKTVGNKIRYAIDTVDATGRVVSTQYRLGGFVKSVAPDMSSAILYNPYARKQWTLKIRQPANKRLRVYYARRAK
ncbi:hypothetical protein ATCV1_Z380R [Acanthocystis turfacea chlorella virus 1]|uniref:Uncharacterized protein Z380R n=1 Tax=Chlorovirus heliozoae TaxID=322019 RepID=A7K8Z0_9PHYC|nr:hypothetical protein ATCV1_Z380R [Acanthocystis turfacea chlorella virus 1]ABT16514.1 hypothetical protein ATCV1_Z380R [Acanthocystis turfacea chlorella virus 1]